MLSNPTCSKDYVRDSRTWWVEQIEQAISGMKRFEKGDLLRLRLLITSHHLSLPKRFTARSPPSSAHSRLRSRTQASRNVRFERIGVMMVARR